MRILIPVVTEIAQARYCPESGVGPGHAGKNTGHGISVLNTTYSRDSANRSALVGCNSNSFSELKKKKPVTQALTRPGKKPSGGGDQNNSPAPSLFW